MSRPHFRAFFTPILSILTKRCRIVTRKSWNLHQIWRFFYPFSARFRRFRLILWKSGMHTQNLSQHRHAAGLRKRLTLLFGVLLDPWSPLIGPLVGAMGSRFDLSAAPRACHQLSRNHFTARLSERCGYRSAGMSKSHHSSCGCAANSASPTADAKLGPVAACGNPCTRKGLPNRTC